MTEITQEPLVKRLERSRDDRMVAGVAGGLARYFDIHPAFYRVGFVVLTLLGGAGILIYAAAALVIPDEGREDSIAADALRNRRERPWPLIGVVLMGLALVILVSRATFWPHGEFGWVLVLLAGAAILWAQRRDRPRPEPPAEGAAEPAPVVAPRRGHPWLRALGITALVVMLLALVATVAAFARLDVSLDDGVGDRTYHVASASDLDRSYKLGIGDLDVNLAGIDDLPAGETRLHARVAIGDLHVTVPQDVTVRYRADAEFGEVEVFGDDFQGHDARAVGVDRSGDGTRVLVVDAEAGAGHVDIERAVR
jgi:phage shock protein PspC (stress-responsive transcriptional regulator)